MRVSVAALPGFVPVLLLGQQTDPRAVLPERPTVATHAYTVAPAILEIETGVESDRFDDRSHSLGLFTNVKIGLSSHVQLNVLVPIVGADAASLAPGDVAVGVKWRLVDRHSLAGSFAILPAIKLPSGSVSQGRGTGTADVSLIIIWSRSIGPVAMDLNVGYTFRSGDGSNAAKHAFLWTASFGGPLYRSAGWVLEYFGYPATSGPAGTDAYSALLFGPTLGLHKSLTIDAGAIVPLTGPQTYGLYAGLVWNAGGLGGDAPKPPPNPRRASRRRGLAGGARVAP